MPKLPVVKPRELIAFLKHQGFFLVRTDGSHQRYHHADGRKTSIAFHNRPLKKGTLKSILRQAKLTTNDLISGL